MRIIQLMLVASVLSGCAPALQNASVPPTKKVELGKPARLPPELRLLLHRRMERHSDEMVPLMLSVLLLNDTAAAEFAKEIAATPRLSRVSVDDDSVNARIPAPFFDFQDQLLQHAKEVVAAAQVHDRDRLAQAYAGLSSTCLNCHRAYLEDPAAEATK